MTMLRIAQAQIPVLTDREKLASALEHTAEKAAGESADFLTLPEMFCCPYDINCFSDYAEEQGGPIWQICSRIARSYHIFLSAGTMPERRRSHPRSCVFQYDYRTDALGTALSFPGCISSDIYRRYRTRTKREYFLCILGSQHYH